MRVSRISPDRIEIGPGGQPPARLAALVLLVIALGPFAATAPGWHWLFSAALLAVALWLLAGRRRPEVVISLPDGTVQSERRAGRLREIVLGGTTYGNRLAYRAEALLAEGGAPVLLVEAEDPASVLDDIGEMARRLSLVVQPGWGLPGGAQPWQTAAAPAGLELCPGRVRVVPERRSHVALTTGLCAAAFLFGLGWFVLKRALAAQPVAPLSVALYVISVLVAIAAVAIVATEEVHVRADGTLDIEQHRLGRTAAVRRIDRAALRGAWGVAPDGGAARHVLVATSGGPVAIRCDEREAEAILALFSPDRPPGSSRAHRSALP